MRALLLLQPGHDAPYLVIGVELVALGRGGGDFVFEVPVVDGLDEGGEDLGEVFEVLFIRRDPDAVAVVGGRPAFDFVFADLGSVGQEGFQIRALAGADVKVSVLLDDAVEAEFGCDPHNYSFAVAAWDLSSAMEAAVARPS